MKEITCSIINDLLPLYADKVLSRDSTDLVEEHLEKCKFCRTALKDMEKPIIMVKDNDIRHIKKLTERVGIKRFVRITLLWLFMTGFLLFLAFRIGTMHLDSFYGANGELMNFFAVSFIILLLLSAFWYWLLYAISFIRALTGKPKQKTQTVRRICISSAITLVSVYIIVTAGFFLLFFGSPAEHEDIELQTEFQYSSDSLLEQAWVIHVASKSGKPINVFRQEMYDKDDRVVGLLYTVHEIPVKSNMMTSSYTMGYSYGDDTIMPPEDFDFTIIIDLKGQSVTYSMREEGLFEKQNNVLYSPETPDSPQKVITSQQDITARTVRREDSEQFAVYDN